MLVSKILLFSGNRMRLSRRLTVLFIAVQALAAVAATAPAAPSPGFERLRNSDEWFIVYQGENPVGSIHSTVLEIKNEEKPSNTLFEIRNEMIVKADDGGKKPAHRFMTREVVEKNLRLRSFETEAALGGIEVKMSGRTDGDMMSVSIMQGGEKIEKKIALSYGCIPMSLLPVFLASFDPEPGSARGVCTISFVLDDVSVGQTWVEAPAATEPPKGSGYARAYAYRVKSPGYRAVLVMSPDGDALEEVQPSLGIVTRRVKSGSQAAAIGAWDPNTSSIVPANMGLAGPEELRFLKVELVWKGVPPEKLSLGSDMQSFTPPVEKSGWYMTVVTIKRKRPPAKSSAPPEGKPASAVKQASKEPDTKPSPKGKSAKTKKNKAPPPAAKSAAAGPAIPENKKPAAFLKGDRVIQAADPHIVKTAGMIVGETADPMRRAELLAEWIYREIKPDPQSWGSVLTAADVLRERRGSGKHRALLFAAMARSLGIPAKICAGKWYSFGAFVDHVWNEVYAGGAWLTIDSSYPTRDEPPLAIKIAEAAGTSELSAVLPAIDRSLILKINDYGR